MKPQFNLEDHTAYTRWRDAKLANYPATLSDITVSLAGSGSPSTVELNLMLDCLQRCNMVIYTYEIDHSEKTEDDQKALVRSLGRQFLLEKLDHNLGADAEGITELEVKTDPQHQRYVPYSKRGIHWHTDGYYNRLDAQIYAMALHCVRPAAEGGANDLVDHELAYIHLREQNPAFIRSLMQPNAMTIPANIVDGKTLRPARSGPVFRFSPSGDLHMRYTERARNIIWKDDPALKAALDSLATYLYSDSAQIFHGRLEAGQGLICNNILHTRSAFEDTPSAPRLLFRLRYFDRIATA